MTSFEDFILQEEPWQKSRREALHHSAYVNATPSDSLFKVNTPQDAVAQWPEAPNTLTALDVKIVCRSFSWASAFPALHTLRYRDSDSNAQVTIRAPGPSLAHTPQALPALPSHHDSSTTINVSAVVTLSVCSSWPRPMCNLIPGSLTIIALPLPQNRINNHYAVGYDSIVLALIDYFACAIANRSFVEVTIVGLEAWMPFLGVTEGEDYRGLAQLSPTHYLAANMDPLCVSMYQIKNDLLASPRLPICLAHYELVESIKFRTLREHRKAVGEERWLYDTELVSNTKDDLLPP